MKPAAQEWLELARKDLRAATVLGSDPSLTAVVAFHCQQAVEKAFKAVIEEKALSLQRTHDLQRLLGIICQLVAIEIDADQLDILNQVYISSRYPMDLGILPTGQPTAGEAQQMLVFAEEVLDRVGSLLDER